MGNWLCGNFRPAQNDQEFVYRKTPDPNLGCTELSYIEIQQYDPYDGMRQARNNTCPADLGGYLRDGINISYDINGNTEDNLDKTIDLTKEVILSQEFNDDMIEIDFDENIDPLTNEPIRQENFDIEFDVFVTTKSTIMDKLNAIENEFLDFIKEKDECDKKEDYGKENESEANSVIQKDGVKKCMSEDLCKKIGVKGEKVGGDGNGYGLFEGNSMDFSKKSGKTFLFSSNYL